ncbi:response regulator transcription factor [Streptomyces globisporus]|uniref:Response regulator transcription factor n=1 Tax=Streptomyces globisporus TaxID=1908 RepID=A0A927GNS7_STRGL|nr:response regulator transcription factor [Streptomyces globisporus]
MGDHRHRHLSPGPGGSRRTEPARRPRPPRTRRPHRPRPGLSNRAVAEELHIGETTVKFHVRNILKKLDVSSRGQAAALARDAGLTPPRQP